MNTTTQNNETLTQNAPLAGMEKATRRILLADDDAEMRAMVGWALEREGYILQECHDGVSLKKWIDRARSRSTNVHFDLVISDIRMPGLTGLDVLADAQSHGDAPPVILISAFCDAETEDLARRLGAAALLPKPFEVEDLVARARELAPIESKTPGSEPLTAEDEDPDGPSFPLEVTFRHQESDDEIRLVILDLAENLERHAEHIHRCRVVIDPVHPGTDDGYRLSLIVSTGGRPIVVEASATDGDDAMRGALRYAFEIATRKLDEERDRH